MKYSKYARKRVKILIEETESVIYSKYLLFPV